MSNYIRRQARTLRSFPVGMSVIIREHPEFGSQSVERARPICNLHFADVMHEQVINVPAHVCVEMRLESGIRPI